MTLFEETSASGRVPSPDAIATTRAPAAAGSARSAQARARTGNRRIVCSQPPDGPRVAVDSLPAVLRPGLLTDSVVLAAPATGAGDACAELGARIVTLGAPALDEEAMAAAVDPAARAIVVGGAELFADGGLTFALDAAWCAVRATATTAFIPGGGGKVVLVAPRPDAAPHALAL